MCFARTNCRPGSSANTWSMRHWSKLSRCENRRKTKLVCDFTRAVRSAFFFAGYLELVARGKNVQDLLQFIPQVRHTRRRFPGKWKRALVPIGLDFLAQ